MRRESRQKERQGEREDVESGVEAELQGGEEARDQPNAAAAEPTPAEEELATGMEELTRLMKEIEELNDRHLRLAAEFENYRKRTREELLSSGDRAQASLVGSLLDVLDDFQRVTGSEAESATRESLLEGIRLVEKKLRRSLKESGVEFLDPEGEGFDPETMEAVMRVPTEEEDDDDQVHQVFQRGVRFKGHLVRPARVAVSKLEE